MASSFSLSRDGAELGFVAMTSTTLGEVRHTSLATFAPKTLTDMTSQVSELELGSRELVSWKSKDGTRIEGVLINPRTSIPTSNIHCCA